MTDYIFQLARGTSAQWAASSRVLRAGEPGLDTDLDIEKHGDGVSLWAALPDTGSTTFARNGVISHAARVNDVRRMKGGRIGVQGKGVVAIRVDHGFDRFRDIHLPLMRARAIPCGFGFVTGSIGNPSAVYEPSVYSWSDARRVVYQGCEVWDHSRDHRDPAPLGNSQYTVADQVDGSRAILQQNELVPVGWTMPGITGALTPGWSDNMQTLDNLGTTEAGQRLMSNYGLIEAYRTGDLRVMPTEGCYLLSHITIDSMTLAAAKTWVDRAVSGIGVELMFHPSNVGTSGYMSLADFTSLLDYIVTKRDTGVVEVLTPSGLAFADPTSTYRMNWLRDASFEGVSKVGTAIGAWTLSTDAGITLRTDGGSDGANYVRFDGTTNNLSQAYTNILYGNWWGAAMEFSAKVRNTHVSAQGRVQIQAYVSSPGGYPDFGTDNTKQVTLPPSTGWTEIKMPFVVPRLGVAPAEALTFRILSAWNATYTAPVDFDDIRIQPI